MIVRVYGVSVRSRAAAIALAAAALAIGAVFVAFGILLLLGVAAVGTVVAASLLLIRSLTGRGPGRINGPGTDLELDPALEVLPPERSAAQPAPHNPARLKGAGPQAPEFE